MHISMKRPLKKLVNTLEGFTERKWRYWWWAVRRLLLLSLNIQQEITWQRRRRQFGVKSMICASRGIPNVNKTRPRRMKSSGAGARKQWRIGLRSLVLMKLSRKQITLLNWWRQSRFKCLMPMKRNIQVCGWYWRGRSHATVVNMKMKIQLIIIEGLLVWLRWLNYHMEPQA